MRPGSSELVRFAPTRTRPARGLGADASSVPEDWRISADEQDGWLTKRPIFGAPVSILKSRLFSMTGSEMEDDPIAREFSEEWTLRASIKNAAGFGPEVFKDPILGPPLVRSLAPGISPEGVANATATPSNVKPARRFTFGTCPDENAMGWSLVPDSVQRSVCVVTHVALGVAAIAGVMAVVWAMNQAGRAVAGE